jgi:hypothetical protein
MRNTTHFPFPPILLATGLARTRQLSHPRCVAQTHTPSWRRRRTRRRAGTPFRRTSRALRSICPAVRCCVSSAADAAPLVTHVSRLQPVRDTRERQLALWKEFILEYTRVHKVRSVSRRCTRALCTRCTAARACKLTSCTRRPRQIFVVHVDEDTPLFCNSAINRASRRSFARARFCCCCHCARASSSQATVADPSLTARDVQASCVWTRGARCCLRSSQTVRTPTCNTRAARDTCCCRSVTLSLPSCVHSSRRLAGRAADALPGALVHACALGGADTHLGASARR